METNKIMKWVGIAVFVGVFALYLYSLPPTVAPYRDAGEMSTVTNMLGIAHPPGYPLYILISFLFTRIVISNPAFTVNLFSTFCFFIKSSIFLFVGK